MSKNAAPNGRRFVVSLNLHLVKAAQCFFIKAPCQNPALKNSRKLFMYSAGASLLNVGHKSTRNKSGPGASAVSWSAMERAKGIEPSYPAWKAGVLPLNYARVLGYVITCGGRCQRFFVTAALSSPRYLRHQGRGRGAARRRGRTHGG